MTAGESDTMLLIRPGVSAYPSKTTVYVPADKRQSSLFLLLILLPLLHPYLAQSQTSGKQPKFFFIIFLVEEEGAKGTKLDSGESPAHLAAGL